VEKNKIKNVSRRTARLQALCLGFLPGVATISNEGSSNSFNLLCLEFHRLHLLLVLVFAHFFSLFIFIKIVVWMLLCTFFGLNVWLQQGRWKQLTH
jgi:hypothetical protein